MLSIISPGGAGTVSPFLFRMICSEDFGLGFSVLVSKYGVVYVRNVEFNAASSDGVLAGWECVSVGNFLVSGGFSLLVFAGSRMIIVYV